MRFTVRRLSIAFGLVVFFGLSAADSWYTREAKSAQQIVDMHDKRHDDYITTWLKDPTSGNSEDLKSIVSARDSATLERDSLLRKSRFYKAAGLLSFLAFFAAILIADVMKKREANREGGGWASERNRAALIATSFTIFFGLVLLAPGIGSIFQRFVNLLPMMLSDIGVPRLGQEVDGFFRLAPLGWLSIVAVTWLFSFAASFSRESR